MTFAGLSVVEMLGLFGAVGAAVTLLYILKLRRRRIEVPFTPLWTHVVVEKQSRSLFRRFRRLLSWLVQIIIVALVVLALGDPKLSGLAGCTSETTAEPPVRHSLVILDASASMASIEGGKTRLAAAKDKAHELVDAVVTNPNHRAMIVQLDATVRPISLWSTRASVLHAAVDEVAPTGALDTPTAVDVALALAEDALRGKPGAEVVMITDRAFSPIPEARARALGLRVIPVGEAGVNVGIEGFNVRPYLDDSLTYAVFYAVRNDSDRPLRATLHLYANPDGLAAADFVAPGRIVDSVALELPAGGVVQDVVNDLKFEGSRVAARVEIAPDDPARDVFPRDDTAFAVVPERRIVRVQLVTEGNLFLHAALFVRENIDFSTVTPDAYSGPEGYDLTIVDRADVDLSKPGNYFLIGLESGGPFDVTGVVEGPAVSRVNDKHPIMRGLKLVDLNIVDMPVLKRERGDEVVAWAGKAPLLMVRHDAAGDRTFVSLAFDLRKSLMPMNYAFPLFMVNVVSFFFQEDQGLLKPNRAGRELSLASTLTGDDLTVRGPTHGPPAYARKVGERLHFGASRIGVYEVRDETGAMMPVAVNLMSPSESAITPRDHDYPAWVSPPPVVIEDDPWLSALWRVLLLIVLAAVALEWFTWNRRVTV